MAQKHHPGETFAHYLTAGVVLLKAYEKSEHFHEHPVITILLFVLGALILVATIFSGYFDRHIKDFRIGLHICESLVLLLVAYYYFDEGKKALPAVYLLAAIGHLISAIFFYRKKVRLPIK